MSVILGVRVRGFGTRNLTWKVSQALSVAELDKPAKAARVTPLKSYLNADYAVREMLDPLENELMMLEYNETITRREVSRREKALDARANEEGGWFPIAEGVRTVTALLEKLGEHHPASGDLQEMARLLKTAAKKGTEFRLYSNP